MQNGCKVVHPRIVIGKILPIYCSCDSALWVFIRFHVRPRCVYMCWEEEDNNRCPMTWWAATQRTISKRTRSVWTTAWPRSATFLTGNQHPHYMDFVLCSAFELRRSASGRDREKNRRWYDGQNRMHICSLPKRYDTDTHTHTVWYLLNMEAMCRLKCIYSLTGGPYLN